GSIVMLDCQQRQLFSASVVQQMFRCPPPHAGLQERRYEMKNTVLAQCRELLHWVGNPPIKRVAFE
ncbi:hypothetical protein, partial [Acetobacter sp. LMG 32666]|uniref:hypothetical protein n=1 Tax=Acetobacter sp. LMG 32666 TaxID=2959295 RepID=UPI0030C8C044